MKTTPFLMPTHINVGSFSVINIMPVSEKPNLKLFFHVLQLTCNVTYIHNPLVKNILSKHVSTKTFHQLVICVFGFVLGFRKNNLVARAIKKVHSPPVLPSLVDYSIGLVVYKKYFSRLSEASSP